MPEDNSGLWCRREDDEPPTLFFGLNASVHPTHCPGITFCHDTGVASHRINPRWFLFVLNTEFQKMLEIVDNCVDDVY